MPDHRKKTITTAAAPRLVRIVAPEPASPAIQGEGWRARHAAIRAAEASLIDRFRTHLNPRGTPAILNGNKLYALIQAWTSMHWGAAYARSCGRSAATVAKAARLAFGLALNERLRPRGHAPDLRAALAAARSASGAMTIADGLGVTIPRPDDVPLDEDGGAKLADDLRRLANELIRVAGLSQRQASHAPAGRKGIEEAVALLGEARRQDLVALEGALRGLGDDDAATAELLPRRSDADGAVAQLARIMIALGFHLDRRETTPRPDDRRTTRGRRLPPLLVGDGLPFFYSSEAEYVAALRLWRTQRREAIRNALTYAARKTMLPG